MANGIVADFFWYLAPFLLTPLRAAREKRVKTDIPAVNHGADCSKIDKLTNIYGEV